MSFITQPSLRNTKSRLQYPELKPRKSIDIQRKWNKMLEEFRLSHQVQQSECEIKRGNSFFKEFLKGDCLEKFPLEVNIPETMLMDEDENLYMLYMEKNRLKKKKTTVEQYQHHLKALNRDLQQKIGKMSSQSKQKSGFKPVSIRRQNSISKMALETGYQFKYKPYADPSVNPLAPYIISRKDSPEPDQIFQKDIINVTTFQQMKFIRHQDIIYQRYILSRNLKAMIIRLCYHTQSNQSTQSDFAYRYQNKNQILKFVERSNTYETGIPLATVSPTESQQYTFEVSKIVGKTLIPYQRMAKNLISYLEKVNSLRIYKAYFDFMIDMNEEIWLTNLKYIELTPSIHLNSLHLNSVTITSTVYCKLCGIIHRRDQVSKTLTFKLLHELVEHLKKRTNQEEEDSEKKQHSEDIYLLFKNLKFNQNINIPCQLCDVCYKLVVSEHQLIVVQKEMARTMNIKINEEITIESINIKNRKRPAYLVDNLYQWRLMLYLSEINHFRQVQNNIYLQYRINGTQSLAGCCKIQKQNDSIFLNYIRLHYFFSESFNIERLLNDSELMIRFTIGTDWNKYIAQGSSGTVSHFKNNYTGGQRHSPTVLIFDNSQNYSELHLTIGLVCDGLYNTSQLNLYRQKDVYLPDSTYHNCNPLPKQWMEMFSPKYALKMMDEEKSQNSLNFKTISRESQHKHLRSLFKKK